MAVLPFARPTASAGSLLYVDTTGSDTTGTGTSLNPWRTITRALNGASNGNRISVGPGTYNPTTGQTTNVTASSRVFSPSTPVTVFARDGYGTVTIGPTSSSNTRVFGIWCANSAGIIFKDLIVNVRGYGGALGNYGSVAAVMDYSDDIEFQNCWFKECGGMHMLVRGGTSSGQVSNRITAYRCRFGGSSTGTGQFIALDETDDYFTTKGSHSIYAGHGDEAILSGSDNLLIMNCIFHGTTPGRHIQLGPQARNNYILYNTFYGNKIGSFTRGIYQSKEAGGFIEFNQEDSRTFFAISPTLIENNLFVNCDGHAVWSGSVYDTISNITVQNNIGWQCLRAQNHSGSDCGLTFHRFASNGNVMYSLGTGNLVVDPLLTNPAGLNFVPAEGSPAINAGSKGNYYPDDDFLGNTRAATPSIGAIDGTTTPPPPPPPPPDPALRRPELTRVPGGSGRISNPSGRIAGLGGGGL